LLARSTQICTIRYVTSLADQMIAALRSGHDDLAAYAARLDEAALTGPSGASEWPVSQVLSHLGSGAEIGLATLEAALKGEAPPDSAFNHSVWDRWNAMPPIEHRDGFLAANPRLVERYEGLDATTRAQLRVDMGFLPAPISVAEAARMRLSEFTAHTWDVKVGADDTARLAPEAVPLLLDAIAGTLGYISRADALEKRPVRIAVELTDLGRSFGLEIADAVAVTDLPEQPDGVLRAPAEAWLRLAAGRLAPRWTPPGVEVTGPVGLDDLRRVFPGY
jgi:uncharacterized protein (TIGR03083 family)